MSVGVVFRCANACERLQKVQYIIHHYHAACAFEHLHENTFLSSPPFIIEEDGFLRFHERTIDTPFECTLCATQNFNCGTRKLRQRPTHTWTLLTRRGIIFAYYKLFLTTTIVEHYGNQLLPCAFPVVQTEKNTKEQSMICFFFSFVSVTGKFYNFFFFFFVRKSTTFSTELHCSHRWYALHSISMSHNIL